MGEGFFLSRAEIEELTGRRRGAAQVNALKRAGIAHTLRADGRPAVARAAVLQPAPPQPPAAPDFSWMAGLSKPNNRSRANA